MLFCTYALKQFYRSASLQICLPAIIHKRTFSFTHLRRIVILHFSIFTSLHFCVSKLLQ
jgi:hypothetical protein